MDLRIYKKILKMILLMNLFLLGWNISDLVESLTNEQLAERLTSDIIFVVVNALICFFLYYRIKVLEAYDKQFKTWRSYDK